MIETMRQLALDFLYAELGGSGDTEQWYRELRENRMEVLFPYLIEAARDSMASNYYVVYPDTHNNDVAILEQRVFKPEDVDKLPFVQSTGSQSPALGPVLKRSFQKGKGAGPSDKILDSTLKAFASIGEQDESWSGYFEYAHQLLSRPILHFAGNVYQGKPSLHKAIEVIEETRTAYLSIIDHENRLPGERQDYRRYLEQILAAEKYSTGNFPPIENQIDSLTAERTTVYPNSIKGAGINLTNVDRIGIFSNLDEANAWKKFALGAGNADLLYTFSFHMRKDFIAYVAGEQALILPHLKFNQGKRPSFVRDFKRYIDDINQQGVSIREKQLLRRYTDQSESIASISILWADFGQSLENVRGMVHDVLPSRLSYIASTIETLKSERSPIFPIHVVEAVEPDIALNSLAVLLKRPGGKKTQKINEGARLFEFKRDTAAKVYHGRQISVSRFWDEALATAKEYLMEIATEGNTYGLLNEGIGKRGSYLTLAGWTKHLAKYIYFLRELEVYPGMSTWIYEPQNESLKAFFTDSQRTSGLDSPHKVYAFLLGVLFGKVMEVQAARRVNVGANALTWLKRLNMTGADLPALYNKVREKLLSYETESRREVQSIVQELGVLGLQIGTPKLSKTDACYYLLLGQSLTKTLIPSREKEKA